MTDAYMEGFCKTAEAHGLDPRALIKTAQDWYADGGYGPASIRFQDFKNLYNDGKAYASGLWDRIKGRWNREKAAFNDWRSGNKPGTSVGLKWRKAPGWHDPLLNLEGRYYGYPQTAVDGIRMIRPNPLTYAAVKPEVRNAPGSPAEYYAAVDAAPRDNMLHPMLNGKTMEPGYKLMREGKIPQRY